MVALILAIHPSIYIYIFFFNLIYYLGGKTVLEAFTWLSLP